MNGTEWTEPGQGGATWGELRQAAAPRVIHFYWPLRSPQDKERTNLRLTGHPLTAYDLKRIEQCEVAR